jgi:hypothetical protein
MSDVAAPSGVPAAPDGSGEAGTALWLAVQTRFRLDEHEETLLREVCHVADTCRDLQQTVAREGPLVTSRLGDVRTNPALVELRAERLLLARLIVALRVPLGSQETGPGTNPAPRLQRRGLRGFQGGAA